MAEEIARVNRKALLVALIVVLGSFFGVLATSTTAFTATIHAYDNVDSYTVAPQLPTAMSTRRIGQPGTPRTAPTLLPRRLPGFGVAAEAGRPASSAVSGKLLRRQLASEEQMVGRGTPIIGAGTRGKLRDAERLAREYGGDPADWAKMSSGRYRDGGGLYDVFETHWYENVRTGAKHEFKTKFPRAGNAFGGAGG